MQQRQQQQTKNATTNKNKQTRNAIITQVIKQARNKTF